MKNKIAILALIVFYLISLKSIDTIETNVMKVSEDSYADLSYKYHSDGVFDSYHKFDEVFLHKSYYVDIFNNQLVITYYVLENNKLVQLEKTTERFYNLYKKEP